MAAFKEFFSRVLNGLAKKIKPFLPESNPPVATGFYTSERNPEVIQAVTDELRRHDHSLLLARLQDLEKAIYHIAGKQTVLLEQQKSLEELGIQTATNIEEMLNGFDTAMNDELDSVKEDSEEETLNEVWETKKPASPLN